MFDKALCRKYLVIRLSNCMTVNILKILYKLNICRGQEGKFKLHSESGNYRKQEYCLQLFDEIYHLI